MATKISFICTLCRRPAEFYLVSDGERVPGVTCARCAATCISEYFAVLGEEWFAERIPFAAPEPVAELLAVYRDSAFVRMQPERVDADLLAMATSAQAIAASAERRLGADRAVRS